MNKYRYQNAKFPFYCRHLARCLIPGAYYRGRLQRVLSSLPRQSMAAVERRVDYYCKLGPDSMLSDRAVVFSQLSPWSRSAYYFDLREHIKYFPAHLRFEEWFGDVSAVPETPKLLKSRPINGDNANSVLLNLNKVRHFNFPRDKLTFGAKKDMAVWRGHAKTGHHRRRLVQTHHDNPLCDIGQTNETGAVADGRAPGAKGYMPVSAQLRHKFILSLEGNDVATNLKWIMASNSVCMMRKPRYETWFMEGTLRAGAHYIELADDFGDLSEKIRHYLAHPSQAEKIIANAHRHVARFMNPRVERVTSLSVLKKYFTMTGQL